jgi:hypothetical protein
VSFGVLVLANVLLEGISPPTASGLVVAAVGIVFFAYLVQRRIRRYRALDELHQRIELESLAAAFAGSFMIFVAYWLLQLVQVLPPLNGLYYVIVMIGLVSSGTDAAWQKLVRGRPAPR